MFKSRVLFVFVCLVCFVGYAHAEVESTLVDTVKLGTSLVAMDVSQDGRTVYGLTDKGQVLIRTSKGKPLGRMDVGTGFDGIKIGPKDDTLFLTRASEGLVKVYSLDFIYDIDVSGSPFQGPENAPVVLVIFSDFQCPYCVRIHREVEKILKEYPGQVKAVLKHFPLTSHKFAMKSAQASMAAHEQGKFWEYYAKIRAYYRTLSDEKLLEFRDALSLDKKRFDKTMNDIKTIEKINRDREEGRDVGVRGTPTAFVNGRRVKPLNYDGLKKAIDDVLNKK